MSGNGKVADIWRLWQQNYRKIFNSEQFTGIFSLSVMTAEKVHLEG